MKTLFATLHVVLISGFAYSQQVLVRMVNEKDVNSIAYPNSAGKTTSSQPHKGTVTLKDGSSIKGKITFFKKKDEFSGVKVNTGAEKKEIEAAEIASIELDPDIFERKYPNNFKNPEKNFQPGYVILPEGTKLTGKVAQLRDVSDYDFFVYTVLFLPERSEVAAAFRGGRLFEFGQKINGRMNVWDGYADGYLLRLVDGRYRLSRNPYSTSKNEFFTAVLNQASDSLGKEAAKAALMKSLSDGKDLNESLENAANAGSVVKEALGNVEVSRKEYLIFDTEKKTATAVNKDTFRDFAKILIANCANSVPQDQAKWDNIEDFIRFLNVNCNEK